MSKSNKHTSACSPVDSPLGNARNARSPLNGPLNGTHSSLFGSRSSARNLQDSARSPLGSACGVNLNSPEDSHLAEDSHLTEDSHLANFRMLVIARGKELYRDLPWRNTFDPYGIWISEVMLQQTQVSRVNGRWQRWMERFPTVDALAVASQADVLAEWQGMGYNRRATFLLASARLISQAGGNIPSDEKELCALPGIGAATAAGIRAFAFNLPSIYIETNVRAVFLHEFFPDAQNVPDSALRPLVQATCPQESGSGNDSPRSWYYALLDYGAYLKATMPNPSRRSQAYTRQTPFEGSRRQKRAALVRILLNTSVDTPSVSASAPSVSASANVQSEEASNVTAKIDGDMVASRKPQAASRSNVTAKIDGDTVDASDIGAKTSSAVKAKEGVTTEELTVALSEFEICRGRSAVSESLVEELLEELNREGTCTKVVLYGRTGVTLDDTDVPGVQTRECHGQGMSVTLDDTDVAGVAPTALVTTRETPIEVEVRWRI